MSWAALCACQSTHDVSPDNHDRVSTAVRDFGSCLSHDLAVVVVVIVVGVVIGVVICCCGVVVGVVVAKPETTHHFRSDVRTSLLLQLDSYLLLGVNYLKIHTTQSADRHFLLCDDGDSREMRTFYATLDSAALTTGTVLKHLAISRDLSYLRPCHVHVYTDAVLYTRICRNHASFLSCDCRGIYQDHISINIEYAAFMSPSFHPAMIAAYRPEAKMYC